MDAVLRDSAVFCALTESGRTGVLRQDLSSVDGTIERVVLDAGGIVEKATVPLEHTCLGCAVREDSLPVLEGMVASGRWERIVVAMPVSAALSPLSRPLADRRITGRIGAHLAATVAVVDVDDLQSDLFGDALLAERDMALAQDDRRSVGEAVSVQIRHADLILTTGDSATGSTLVDHLCGDGSARGSLLEIGPELFFRRHVHRLAEARIDPHRVRPAAVPDAHGVWTLDLASPRPMHPGRLLEQLGALADDAAYGRGRFQLASRPRTAGEWDGVGGQLSIGNAGPWPDTARSTRLVYTGIEDVRDRLRAGFADVLVTDQEMTGGDRWRLTDDGFDPWLGQRHQNE